MKDKLQKIDNLKNDLGKYNYKLGIKRLTVFLSIITALIAFAYSLNLYGDFEKAFLAAFGVLLLIWALYWMIKWVISGFTKGVPSDKKKK